MVKIFLWCWTGLLTMTVLPFAVAAMRGWAPRRTRGRQPRARLQVQGVSLLVLYVAAMLHPVFRIAGILREDTDFFLPILFAALMFLAMGLQGGAALNDWFNRAHAPNASGPPIAPRSAPGLKAGAKRSTETQAHAHE
ncbi:hypothetical protein [Streptomyces pristinaespiralis]|uniref:hypothetical protein n=1 Tax=Streptomyces pristinaespiralis TaxID=38300 RepID=UPI0033FEE080